METNDKKDNTSVEIHDILQKIQDGRKRERKREDECREFEDGKLFLVQKSSYFLVLIQFFLGRITENNSGTPSREFTPTSTFEISIRRLVIINLFST